MARRRRRPRFRSKEAKRKYEAYKHIHICPRKRR